MKKGRWVENKFHFQRTQIHCKCKHNDKITEVFISCIHRASAQRVPALNFAMAANTEMCLIFLEKSLNLCLGVGVSFMFWSGLKFTVSRVS